MKKGKIVLAVVLSIIIATAFTGTIIFAAGNAAPTDEMADIKTDFAAYLVQDTKTIDNDGYVGKVKYTVYYDKSQGSKVTSGYRTDNPIVVYTVNTNTPRVGMDSNKTIIQSMLDRGMVVVVLDYLNNVAAVSPKLEDSGQKFRIGIQNGDYFDASASGSVFSSGKKYYENFLVPSGCNLTYADVFFEIDKHAVAGTLDKIVENWNTDFKGTKGNKRVKWATGNTTGTRKSVAKAFDGTSPVWYNENGEEDADGLYTKVKWTVAKKITDCVEADGSALDYNLYMHLVYPTNPKKAAPVSILASSGGHPTTLHTPESDMRGQSVGFLYQGYANVVFDYTWMPMGRNASYGYYDGKAATGSVTGDHMNYALHMYNDKLVNTAAMRRIRYLSLSDNTTYKFDNDSFVVYGNSKGGWFTFLGEQIVQGPLVNASDYSSESALKSAIDKKLASFAPKRVLDGHNGETRYQAGETAAITGGPYTGSKAIAGGTLQPWLTYNGVEIVSGALVTYASNGDSIEDVSAGHGPIVSASHMYDTNSSQYGVSSAFANVAKTLNIPSVHFEVPLGHTLASGPDMNYGYDTYRAFFDFCNYYLKGEPVKVLYSDPVSGAVDYEVLDDIVIKFVGEVSASEISKVTISSAAGALRGTWSSCFGDTEWHFTPESVSGGTVYTIKVPRGLKGKNGVAMTEEYSASFKTVGETQTEVSTVSGSRGTYMYFTAPTLTENEFVLRFHAENNAANIANIYALTGFSASNPDSATIGEQLGKVSLRGIGSYEVDITEYIKANEGKAVAFLLKLAKTPGDKQIKNFSFASNPGGVNVYASNTESRWGVSVGGASDALEVKMLPVPYAGKTTYRDEYAFNLESVLGKKYQNYQNRAGVLNIGNLIGSSKLTKDDLGRQFTITLRIYDTVSRQITLKINSTTDKNTYQTIDYDNVMLNVKTEANKWVEVSIPYTVYELDYGYVGEHVKNLAVSASATGAAKKPFYLDDFTVTEHITDVEISTVTLAARSFGKGTYKAPSGTKPVALFNGTTKLGEYDTLGAALSAYASGNTVKLLSNLVMTDSDSFSGFLTKSSVSTWDIDLNGYKLISENKAKSPLMLVNSSSGTVGTLTTINLFGGSIVLNDRPLIAYDGSTSAGAGKSVFVNLENLFITTERGAMLREVISSSKITSGSTLSADIKIKNCNFKLLDKAHAKNYITMLPAGTGDLTINYKVVGGNITLGSLRWISIYNDIGTVLFSKSGNDFVTLTLPSYGSPGSTLYRCNSGDRKFRYLKAKDGMGVYTLLSDTGTRYGDIDDAKSNSETYPFVAFINGKSGSSAYLGAGKTLYGTESIMDIVKTKMKENVWNPTTMSYGANEIGVTILMRRDYALGTSEKYDNISQIQGTVTIDLGGHTLSQTSADYALFESTVKGWSSSGDEKVFPTTITVKSGKISVKNNAVIDFSARNTISGVDINNKKLTYNFNNVTFKLASGATATSMITKNSADADTPTATTSTFVNINNCTFDFSKVYPPAKIDLFDFSSTASKYINNIVVMNGSEIICKDMKKIGLVKQGSGTLGSLDFGASGGRMLRLRLASDVAAPAGLFYTRLGEAYFELKSNDAYSTVYELTPKAVTDFKMKTNVVFDTNISFNLYLLATGSLKNATVGDKVYGANEIAKLKTTVIDNETYYIIPYKLDPKAALSDVKCNVVLGLPDGSEYSGCYTFGVMPYVEDALAAGTLANAERQILLDMLSYARAAHLYFGTATAEELLRADSVLGANYDSVYKPSFACAAVTPAAGNGVIGITFILESSPKIKLTLAEGIDATKFVFTVGGREVDYTVSSGGRYIYVELYAYEINGVLEYEVSGESFSGQYNLKSYYDWACSNNSTKNNAALITLIERFAKYAESADTYKGYIISSK